MVDWQEDDSLIAVCSRYEQSLEDMIDEDSFTDRSERTPGTHWDVVGNAILSVVDQSPKPIYWYTFGQPAGMRETHPLPAYEQLIASMVDHPLRNRVRAYVDQSEGISRNFHYVVEGFAIDAVPSMVLE